MRTRLAKTKFSLQHKLRIAGSPPYYVDNTYWYGPSYSRISHKADIVKGDHVRPLAYFAGGRDNASFTQTSEQWDFIYPFGASPYGGTIPWVRVKTLMQSSRIDSHAFRLPYNLGGFGVNENLVDIGWDSILEGKAGNGCLKKAGAKTLSPLVTMGEGLVTAQYLRNKGSVLVNSLNLLSAKSWVKAIRRVDGRKPSAIRKAIEKRKSDELKRKPAERQMTGVVDFASAALLEYRYAVTPLVSDIADYADALTNGTKWYYSCRSAVGSSEDSFYGDVAISVNRGCRMKLSYEVNSYNDHLIQQLGVSPGGIANLVWELIPLSFVIDMGVGISSYLDLLSATQGLTFAFGSVTQKVTMEAKLVKNEIIHGVNTQTENRIDQSESKWAFERRILSDFPTPVIEYDDPFNLYNNATLSSLGWQLNKRRIAKLRKKEIQSTRAQKDSLALYALGWRR
jgi:hypothetical protein